MLKLFQFMHLKMGTIINCDNQDIYSYTSLLEFSLLMIYEEESFVESIKTFKKVLCRLCYLAVDWDGM